MAKNGADRGQGSPDFGNKGKAPTVSDLLGFGKYQGQDFTANRTYPPNLVPLRKQMPGRGAPEDSLDRFSPDAKALDYDFAETDDSDTATPEEITDPVLEANSQTDITEDTPSVKNPNRFVFQNRG